MVYRTHANPVSVISRIQKGYANREVVRVKANIENTTNIRDLHKVENFIVKKWL